MALGYYVDAERYLGEALAAPDHPWVAKNLATLKSQLQAAKGMIGELAISGEPMGAEVWVNGKQVGRLPLPAPIRLDKGRAEIQIRAAGYVATSDTVAITGGKREERSFRLVREPVAGAGGHAGDAGARRQHDDDAEAGRDAGRVGACRGSAAGGDRPAPLARRRRDRDRRPAGQRQLQPAARTRGAPPVARRWA